MELLGWLKQPKARLLFLQWFGFTPQTDHILSDQVELVRKNFAFALMCACGGGWAVAGSLASYHDAFLWGWIVCYSTISVALIYLVRRTPQTLSPRSRANRLMWSMFTISLVWVVLAVRIVLKDQAEYLLVYGMIGAAVIAGALAFASPYLPVYLMFMSPFLLVLWLSALWMYGPDIYVALSWGIPIYFLANYYFSNNYYRSTLESIQLKYINQGLLSDLEIQIENAESARKRAEDAVQAKSKFLAAASHDLRQPIHALGLFLAALDRSSLSLKKQEILANADSALHSCREMLEALLDFSRIEAGIVTSNPVNFALQPMLYRLFKEFGQESDRRNLVLRLHDTPLATYADPILVELVLRNFLTNGIRYTQTGGVLMGARLNRSGQEICLEVWDTGIGIAPENQQEVFREFYQLGNPERDQTKGLGLGLAIVDGLARRMGARVSLSSRLGKGSVFRLHLPVANSSPAQRTKYTSNHAQDLGSLEGVKVLAIDDNASVRKAILLILEQRNCDAKAAASIDEALAIARHWTPDILISDYRLEGHRTGGDAVRQLRERLGAHLPAIVVTGDTDPERLREAHGIQALLLHKPITANALSSAIARALTA